MPPRSLVASQMTAALEAIAIGTAYIGVSATLITFNKYMMQPGHFPHAVQLTATHMSVTLGMTLSLYAVAPRLFQSMDTAIANWKTVLKFIAPLGLLFAVGVLCSNLAYQYSTVAFLQFCKEGNVALMFFMSCLAGTQQFSWQKLAILSVIILGCSICATGEIQFVMIGLIFQLTSQLAECSKNLIAEVVMSGAGLKLDVLTFVMFQAPCSLLPLMLGCIYTWTPEVSADLIAIWPLLLLNASVAFVLNLLIAISLKNLSALAFVIIGIVKDAVIVLSSSALFGDPIAQIQRVGFCITLSGVALWGKLKMEEQAEAHSKKQAGLAEDSTEEMDPLLAREGSHLAEGKAKEAV
mmetsp:Transcript_52164/g.93909  ORF Transcript_52164/g.93909 Transcript_52164/m.93909 type:complete len:352 (-) Transcript_52164:205-1260(-)